MKNLLLVCIFALIYFTLAGGPPPGYYDADGSSVPARDISSNDQNNFNYGEGQNKMQNDQVNQIANQLAQMMNENLNKQNMKKKDSLLDTTAAHKKNALNKQNALKKNKASNLIENENRKRNNMKFNKNNQNFNDQNNKVAFQNHNDNVDANSANKSNKNRAQKQYADNTKKKSTAYHQIATNAFDQDSGFGFQGIKGLGGFAAPTHTSKYSHAQKHKFDNEFADSQKLNKAAESMNNASHKNLKKRKNDNMFNKQSSKKNANKNSINFNQNNDVYNKNKNVNKIDQYNQRNSINSLSENDLAKVLKKLSTAQLSKLLSAKKAQLAKKNAANNASHNFGQKRNLAKDLGNKSGARKDWKD